MSLIDTERRNPHHHPHLTMTFTFQYTDHGHSASHVANQFLYSAGSVFALIPTLSLVLTILFRSHAHQDAISRGTRKYSTPTETKSHCQWVGCVYLIDIRQTRVSCSEVTSYQYPLPYLSRAQVQPQHFCSGKARASCLYKYQIFVFHEMITNCTQRTTSTT